MASFLFLLQKFCFSIAKKKHSSSPRLKQASFFRLRVVIQVWRFSVSGSSCSEMMMHANYPLSSRQAEKFHKQKICKPFRARTQDCS
ncbi:hypothetical protein CEXT_16541 [Caerostris extrusa]|uniref:Secreted protein n=1 Tax=Caerostris extrusa TaxID=172846 RepID=A0AAV4RS70_CAEEX|nr:hypothetical protein CEXT_16541 [Caerostris extrusa]